MCIWLRHVCNFSNILALQIQTTATRIIHCAWQLDFNITLRSFEEPHIAGVRHLADLAMQSPKEVCPRLIFISSIAACSQSGPGSIIEDCVDMPPPVECGYGQVGNHPLAVDE